MDTVDKLATAVAEDAAPHADRHDLEGSFVEEGVAAARDVGYLAAPVPAELGGGGALTADMARAQRIIARSCGSTALACSMHMHIVLAAAWRWRRGDTVVEPLLPRVAGEHLVVAPPVATTGPSRPPSRRPSRAVGGSAAARRSPASRRSPTWPPPSR